MDDVPPRPADPRPTHGRGAAARLLGAARCLPAEDRAAFVEEAWEGEPAVAVEVLELLDHVKQAGGDRADLTLRTRPEPALRPEVDRIRGELAELAGRF